MHYGIDVELERAASAQKRGETGCVRRSWAVLSRCDDGGGRGVSIFGCKRSYICIWFLGLGCLKRGTRRALINIHAWLRRCRLRAACKWHTLRARVRHMCACPMSLIRCWRVYVMYVCLRALECIHICVFVRRRSCVYGRVILSKHIQKTVPFPVHTNSPTHSSVCVSAGRPSETNRPTTSLIILPPRNPSLHMHITHLHTHSPDRGT